ncbi:MAG: amino acid adenylation domain-containing protein [Flavobacteriales bacterium]
MNDQAEIASSAGFRPFSDEGNWPLDLVDRFQRIVGQYAANTAVRDNHGAINYGELDLAVRAFAAGLQGLGLVPGDRVVLLMEQDRFAAVAMLAVLHAGCTYVVLDVADPEQRLTDLVRQAQVAAVACMAGSRELAGRIAAGTLHIVTCEELLRSTPAAWERRATDQETPAYIIFTSGTTGRPKGVMQSHAGVLVHIRNYTDNLRLGPGDRMNMVAMHGYDAALMDLYGALLNGAALHMWDIRRDGLEACVERIVSERITVFHSTPSVFRTLFRRVQPTDTCLRVVVLGGERTTAQDVRLFQTKCPAECVLVNGLGPTECTLICQGFFSTMATVNDPVPIGRPVTGLAVQVQDEEGLAVPSGGTGELIVRGSQVAIGYFGSGSEQSSAFTTHADGSRTYHTGDLVKILPDGQLVFLGRKDGQLKVRGIRIEPGEITEALNAHPLVAESAVILRGAEGAEALHAYVVPAGRERPEPRALRAHLSQRLPVAWVPATYNVVEQIPLRANGKTDLAALPEPVQAQTLLVPPATHLEKSLVMVWRHVLGQPIGLETNFFEVGGTSLHGLRILARVTSLLGGENLPLALIFKHPTVRGMAQCIDDLSEGLRWSNLVAVRPEGDRTPVVCVHGDEANYHLSRMLPASHPFLAFFHQGEDGMAMTHNTFPAIATHYAHELEQALPQGPVVVCGYSFGGVIALELAQRLREHGRTVPLLVILDSQGPDFVKPVTVKGLLLRLRDIKDRIRCEHWLGKGLPIPEHLRNFHIMDTYGKAMRSYRAGPWTGPALLIRCAERELEPTGWDRILPDLRTVVVPGDHQSIITAMGIEPVVEAIQQAMSELAL